MGKLWVMRASSKSLKQEAPENRTSMSLLTLYPSRHGPPQVLMLLLFKILPTLHGHNQPWSIAWVPLPAPSSHHSALQSACDNRNTTQIPPTACPETKISRCHILQDCSGHSVNRPSSDQRMQILQLVELDQSSPSLSNFGVPVRTTGKTF